MTNAYYLRSNVENILDTLLNLRVTILHNPVTLNEECGVSTITWGPSAPGRLFRLSGNHIDEYPQWVEAQAYSAILFDGSLLQLTWKVCSSEIIGHRLAYIPCPLRLDEELLKEEPVIDVWDLARDNAESYVVLRSPVRFDYDPNPKVVGDNHPASHLTFNIVDCRIPVAFPLGPHEFFRFVFKNFYPSIWEETEYLRKLKSQSKQSDVLRPAHRQEAYIQWDSAYR